MWKLSSRSNCSFELKILLNCRRESQIIRSPSIEIPLEYVFAGRLQSNPSDHPLECVWQYFVHYFWSNPFQFPLQARWTSLSFYHVGIPSVGVFNSLLCTSRVLLCGLNIGMLLGRGRWDWTPGRYTPLCHFLIVRWSIVLGHSTHTWDMTHTRMFEICPEPPPLAARGISSDIYE